MEERFVIKDLMDNAYSVSWPGYEFDVCDNPVKARNLLKILFDEINLEDVNLAVKKEEYSGDEFVVSIPWMTYMQNPDRSGDFLMRHYSVVGVKFDTRDQAETFKEIMEKRLAWRRLSGKSWS